MDESIINVNNIIKFNWENIIILSDFINSLELETKKEFSVISKLIRAKLKYSLFNSIRFSGDNFEKYFKNNEKNLLWGYFDFDRHLDSGSDEIYDHSIYKKLKLAPALKELELQLNNFRFFVKSIIISDAVSAGYYLFPILTKFDNLTKLRIINCTIPLIEFSKLSQSLKKLESIEITISTLIKPLKEKFTQKDIQFPKTLKSIAIIDCEIGSSKLLSSPYKFLFQNNNNRTFEDFILPPTSIPSLLYYSYRIIGRDDKSTNLFLSKNLQLEYLSFESNFLDQFKVDYIGNSKNLKKLSITCQNDTHNDVLIPPLKSIEKLKFTNPNAAFYSTIEKLCVSSPNLKELAFTVVVVGFDNYMVIMERILVNIIPKLKNLKVLNLQILGVYDEKIDFTNIGQVENLIIQSNIDILPNIKFLNSKSLKKIEFIYNKNLTDTNISINDIKDKYINIKDWKFDYRTGYIKGDKIKQR